MNRSADEHASEWHLGQTLTSYCFGGLSDQDRQRVEEHLLGCEACWQEFQTLDAAVRILRFDGALMPTLPVNEMVSLLGLSSRLDRPFGGHATFALTIAGLYGLEWTIGLWSELGYAYDRFGTLAWALSVPVATWAAAALAAALWSDAHTTRTGQATGLIRSSCPRSRPSWPRFRQEPHLAGISRMRC